MKKLFFAAFATFAMVSISSVFANKAMMANAPEGLASDSDTTVTAPAEPVEAPAEPSTSSEKPSTEVAEPLTSNTAGETACISWSRRTRPRPTPPSLLNNHSKNKKKSV